jgi:hypothetical protein
MSRTKEKIEAALNEGPSPTATPIALLKESIKQQLYTIDSVGIPDLTHFLYKAQNISQMTAPVAGPPFDTPREQKR